MVILSIFTLIQSCSKEELKLNEDYITVSDLTRYCRCKCREISPCENKEVKIKGHIDYYTFNANFSNISYSIGGFRLKDIRNGYSIEVYFNMNDSTDKKIAIDKDTSLSGLILDIITDYVDSGKENESSQEDSY